MRLCLVSRQSTAFDGGDVGLYIPQACRAFHAAGHEVHVLTDSAEDLARLPATVPGVQVHLAERGSGPAALSAWRNEPMRYAMSVYQTLERLHSGHPFDLIEFPDFLGPGAFALQARRTLGKLTPAVLAVRLHLPSQERRQLNRLALLDLEGAAVEHQEAVALRGADLLLSPTQALLAQVGTRLGLRQPAAIIPSPISPLAPPLPSPPVRTGPSRLLFFGRLEYRAGLHLLIEAVCTLLSKQLDVECLFVGEDTPTGPSGQSLRAWLERRIPRQWRERLRFQPARPFAELLPDIRSAAACCFPSLGVASPDACQQALAAGAVVVASDAGGLGEFLEDGRSGLLFPSGDVSRLAAALERAVVDAPLRQSLREAASQRAAGSTPERFAEQVERAVQQLAEAPRSEPPPAPRSKARSPRPDVSILVPYYNMGRYLPETLRSLWGQTFQDYEILLVDDGSTDPESQRLLDTLDDSRLQVIRKQNGGLSSARNAGLQRARGRWILPVDPDDLLAPTFLEKAVGVMGRTPGLGYVTSLVAYFTDAPEQPTGGWVPWGLERESLWLENVASTCTALMERERVLELGGYDEWLTSFEDWDVFCGLAERGYEGAVLPEFLFFYRQRPDSMTRTEATRSRQALIAYLVQKHPGLPQAPERAMRIQLGEVQRLQERIRHLSDKPLRYQLADRANDALKRFRFAHEALRQASQRLRRPW